MDTTENQALVFCRDYEDHVFVLFEHYVLDGPNLLYSPDGGQRFYVLAMNGMGSSYTHGDKIEESTRFEHPALRVGGKLDRVDNIMIWTKPDGTSMVFRVSDKVDYDPSMLVAQPYSRRTEYICQFPNGDYLYVGADDLNFSYESFRLYVIELGGIREVQVNDVTRFRDGGTTFIKTEEEMFYSPSPFDVQNDPSLHPKWGDIELVGLERLDFDAIEAPCGLVHFERLI